MKWTSEPVRQAARKLRYPMSLIPCFPDDLRRVYGKEPTLEQVAEDTENGRLKVDWNSDTLPELKLEASDETR